MYLNKAVIENVGPISRLELETSFYENGNPKPLVLAGKNGSGKTVFISHVVDALTELACGGGFRDVVPGNALDRPYFKVTGPINQKVGAEYGFSYLSFVDGDTKFAYIDKTGKLDFNLFHQKIGNELNSNEGWKDEGNIKLTRGIDEEKLATIFQSGAYSFFPVNRFEEPHWANKRIKREQFTFRDGVKGILGKPLVITTSLNETKNWLLDVALDKHVYGLDGAWKMANILLKEIMQDPEACLGIATRKDPARISIGHRETNGSWKETTVPTLDNLSTGQSVLLNLFLSIIRYSDTGPAFNMSEVKGIVIIDEIDLHLHTYLQSEVLPKLIARLPKVQFIITTHSPFFLLGLGEKLGGEFTMVDMPTGDKLSLEQFSEFEYAFAVIKKTGVFSKEMERIESEQGTKPLLFVEGVTDRTILSHAWTKLHPGEEMPFKIEVGHDCFLIKNTLSRGNIFKNQPGRKILGLLDFDSAFDSWEKLSQEPDFQEKPGRTDATGLLVKNKTHPGYLLLLPVPRSRKKYASKDFGKHSCLTIELLFKDELIEQFCEKKKVVGGGTLLKFIEEKKVQFAESTAGFTAESFNNFKPLFQAIGDAVSAS